MNHNTRKCVVCGAHSQDRKTCDSVCTRAMRASRTREQQYIADIQAEEEEERIEAEIQRMIAKGVKGI